MNKQKILKDLELACTKMLNLVNIPMVYHRHVLRIAEIEVLRLFPSGIIKGPGAIPFGFLLGSTVVNNINGAQWCVDEFEKGSNVFDLKVEIETSEFGKHVLYPMQSVINYLNDNERRLTCVYDTVKFTSFHSPEDIKKMESDEDGWISMKGGFTFRTLSMADQKFN